MSSEWELLCEEPIGESLTENQYNALLHIEHKFGKRQQFYLLYRYFAEGMSKFSLFRILGEVADMPVQKRAHYADLVTAGHWVAKNAGILPPRDSLFWQEAELQKEGVAWAAKVLDLVDKEPAILQAFSLHLELLKLYSRCNYRDKSELETRLYGSDDISKKYLVEDYRALYPMVCLDIEMIRFLIAKSMPLWLQHMSVSPETMGEWSQEFYKSNEEKINRVRQAYATKMDQLKKEYDIERKTQALTEKEAGKSQTLDSTAVTQEKAQEEQRDMTTEAQTALAKDGKKEEVTFTNVSVMFVDDPNKQHIILPKGMKYGTAREWLTKVEEEENRTFQFQFKFRGWFPFDAMWAVYRALAEVYGFAHVADFQGPWGPEPPTSLMIEIGYGVKQQIPWGPIQVAKLSAPLVPGIDLDNGLPCLHLSAKIKNHERPTVDMVIKKAEEILRTSSIYRGKAVEIDFTAFNPRDFRFDVERAPKFMDTNVTEEELILPQDVLDLVETNIWTPIRNAQVCREQKIPLRRNVLMAGKYGVGKTLAARVTAMLCENNKWTFLYLKDLNQLPQALYFAKQYEPCTIFAEDVNRVVSGDRDAEMDKLFNTIDGIDRKNHEVMTIFTTNNLEDIHAGMLRPGRIDAVITITPPDEVAAARLVRHYGRDIIDPEADLAEVGVMLKGQIPAIIREAVERSKLSAIKDTKLGQTLVVKASHLRTAVLQMLEHAKLLQDPPTPKPDLVLLGEALGTVLVQGLYNTQTFRTDDQGEPAGTIADAEFDGMDRTNLKKVPKLLMDHAGRPNEKSKNHKNTPAT